MRFLILFVLPCLIARAQEVNVVAPQTVVKGSAFQVVYQIAGSKKFRNIASPHNDSIELIYGPQVQRSFASIKGKNQPIVNVSFTFRAMEEGEIRIPKLPIQFEDDTEILSPEKTITIAPKRNASFVNFSNFTDISLYILSPNSNENKLIEENLFIKTEVDKTTCYVGEAIEVTFKLYSRLQSSTKAINASSLYGFSAMDMLDIYESHVGVESINGKIYNTAILRKVQLYPQLPGKLTIDPMDLEHKIEFLDSPFSKNKHVVTKISGSPAVDIIVKPLPDNKPADYENAVGQFSISVSPPNLELEVGKEEKLNLVIEGRGNFIQQVVPEIKWPQGFEVYGPQINESFSESKSPMQGVRTCQYTIVAQKPGNFTLAPFSLCFFDPERRSFQTVHTDSIRVVVTPATQIRKSSEKDSVVPKSNRKWLVWPAAILCIAAIAFFAIKKKKQG